MKLFTLRIPYYTGSLTKEIVVKLDRRYIPLFNIEIPFGNSRINVNYPSIPDLIKQISSISDKQRIKTILQEYLDINFKQNLNTYYHKGVYDLSLISMLLKDLNPELYKIDIRRANRMFISRYTLMNESYDIFFILVTKTENCEYIKMKQILDLDVEDDILEIWVDYSLLNRFSKFKKIFAKLVIPKGIKIKNISNIKQYLFEDIVFPKVRNTREHTKCIEYISSKFLAFKNNRLDKFKINSRYELKRIGELLPEEQVELLYQNTIIITKNKMREITLNKSLLAQLKGLGETPDSIAKKYNVAKKDITDLMISYNLIKGRKAAKDYRIVSIDDVTTTSEVLADNMSA